jgi:hypothetical protein
MAMTLIDKIASILDADMLIAPRDPALNTDHDGAFMVVEAGYTDHELPTKDGRNGPWCVVGNDIEELIEAGFQYAESLK